MFDISFSEIAVIAVVAMIVIGPERLPKTVRTIGLLMGRAQRYVSEVKADIQREMELEELQKARKSLQDIGKDIEQSVKSAVQETEKAVKQAEGSVRDMGAELNRIADDKPATQMETQAVAQTAGVGEMSAPTIAADTVAASVVAGVEAKNNKAEPSATVPVFLQGEVALSIPETPPTSDRKPGA
ncbi:MAG: Sec-independent protein translocase protein TatB [Proteobacteria bacterium]|nr:Sec-independent protein translocase protein TatB [Pseudomonadota bacterium]